MSTQEEQRLAMLQAACAHPAYADAKRALERLNCEIRVVNESAAAGLAEGLEETLEETLTLHQLHVLPELGVSFKTTNLIESVMARLEAKTRRVTNPLRLRPRRRLAAQDSRYLHAGALSSEVPLSIAQS